MCYWIGKERPKRGAIVSDGLGPGELENGTRFRIVYIVGNILYE